MTRASSILILDDCTDLLELLSIVIARHCHCEAITAASLADIIHLGEKALLTQLAILDINLGANQPNGMDAYHWLRKNCYDKPIYFLTGHAKDFPLVAEAELLGDAKILTKPMDAHALVKIVRTPHAS
jgi:DNA-binding NtrC family response regulator